VAHFSCTIVKGNNFWLLLHLSTVSWLPPLAEHLPAKKLQHYKQCTKSSLPCFNLSVRSSGSARLPSLLLRTMLARSEPVDADREWQGEGVPLSDRCLPRSGRVLFPPAPATLNQFYSKTSLVYLESFKARDTEQVTPVQSKFGHNKNDPLTCDILFC